MSFDLDLVKESLCAYRRTVCNVKRLIKCSKARQVFKNYDFLKMKCGNCMEKFGCFIVTPSSCHLKLNNKLLNTLNTQNLDYFINKNDFKKWLTK